MYLYEENSKEIKVYSYAPKKHGLYVKEFKEETMSLIPKEKRVFKAETNEEKFPLHPEILKKVYTIDELNYEKKKFFKTFFHKISEYKNWYDSGYFYTLEYYYDGSYTHCPMVLVKTNKGYENWIITDNYTIYRDNFLLHGIINVPDILRDLHLLENGRFNDLSNKQLKFFTSLYQFRNDPIAVYNKTIIRDMVHDGVVQRECCNNNDTIQRLRKIYK